MLALRTGNCCRPLVQDREEMLRQREHVLGSLTQWWEPQNQHREPVGEIIAECAGAHSGQIAGPLYCPLRRREIRPQVLAA